MKNKFSPNFFHYLIGGIVLTGAICFRLRLLHLPIDRDEGEFAYAGWRMIHGGVPYLDYYNMKMPGIYAAYAFLFLLFGSTVEAIRLGLLLVNLLNTFFVFKLGKNRGNERTGIYSAICYLVFSIQIELQGTCSHAESFAMMFVLSGLVLFLNAGEKKSTRKIFLSGVLFGLAFLMKQPAFSFALMVSLLLMLDAIRTKTGWKYFFKSSIGLSAGALLPVLLTTFILIAEGAGSNFRLFAFEYAREYVSYLNLQDGWSNCSTAFLKAVKPNLLLWTLVPVSIFVLLLSANKKNHLSLLIFFLFSFLAVSAGFYFRPHYFQFLLPAVSILAATAISTWEDVWKEKNNSLRRLHSLSIPFLVIAISFFIFQERSLFSMSKDEDFIRKIYGHDYFNATKKVADFISENSNPDSKVAIFGAEPEIWFYSKRMAASGYLYVYPLLENQKFAPAMRQQFYDEIKNSKPDILLYTSNDGTWYASEPVHKEMYDWYKTYRDSSFKRIALIDMPYDAPTVYYWTEDTTIHPANEENYIEIYKRK